MPPPPSIARRLKAPSTVATVVYSPDGRRLAAACGDSLAVWDPDTGEEVLNLALEPRGAYEIPMAFSSDSQTLAVATSGILLVDVASGLEAASLPSRGEPKSFAWSLDGALLAIAYDDGCDVVRISVGQVIAHIATREVTHVAFEDERTLVVASCIALVRYPFDPEGSVMEGAPPSPSPEAFAPVAYRFARIADGWLADGGDEGALEVYAFRTLEPLRTLTLPPLVNRRYLSATASGESFAIAAEDAELSLRRIFVFDSRSGDVRQDVDLYAHTDYGGPNIRSLAFRPGVPQMAIAAGDEVLVWLPLLE